MKASNFFGAIEAGGTKVLCAVADDAGQFVEQTRIPTADPETTFRAISEFYRNSSIPLADLTAVGVACFGPLDLDRTSTAYGKLMITPKHGWSSVDVRGEIASRLNCPVEIETDVNGAALAEGMFGAGMGLDRFCYVTVGTGIGVGVIENGSVQAGAGHPEAGHMRLSRAEGDEFSGICSFHHDCAEGLASGPAMRARWNLRAEEIPDGHVAWDYEAHYIAALCCNLTYSLRPQRIILGGGVMERSAIYEKVRSAFRQLMAGYALDRNCRDEERFIVKPALTSPSPGLVGALLLARRAGQAALDGGNA